MTDHLKGPVQSEDIFYPVSKESMFLRFHMEMWRKGALEGDKDAPKSGSRDNEGLKEGGCKTDDAENGEGGDLVIVSMKKTSITMVSGRGCTDEGCAVNEVVLVAQSSKVTLGAYRFEFGQITGTFHCIVFYTRNFNLNVTIKEEKK